MSNIAFQRSFEFNRDGIDEEKRTVELSFSSTEEYERWFGIEILSHKVGAVDLSRLNQSSPLLLDHDARQQIGVIEKAWIEGEKGRALVRFSKSQRADEVFQDVLDGIRKNVSVGYQVHEMKLVETRDNGLDVYEVTKWTPFEVSIVSVPADITVGVGRSAEEEFIKNIKNTEVRTMETKETKDFDVTKIQIEARKEELARIREITAIGERLGMIEDARKFVDEGKSIDEFRKYALEKMPEPKPFSNVGKVDVDLSKKEQKEYSILRALNIAAFGGDGFELDVHQEIARKLGRNSRGIFIPLSLRALTSSTADTPKAGYGVQTDVGDLIEILRNKMLVKKLGATILGDLNGPVSFPRQAAASTFSWTAEAPGSDLADSDAVFEQVSLSPKSGMATTAYSKQLLAQNSFDVEAFVRNDLARISALGVDYAAINGTGSSNQPTGILNTSGVGLVVGGTDGAAPTWSHITQLWSEVAVDNADIGSLAFLTNPKVAGKLMTTEKAPNTAQFICTRFPDAEGMTDFGGMRAGISNQVPSDLTKGTSTGVCSAIIFGNFSDLLIGEWGVLEVIVDPYSKKKQGLVEVTSFLMADIAIRHPESFAVMKDALTA